jgi:hypothetical protein
VVAVLWAAACHGGPEDGSDPFDPGFAAPAADDEDAPTRDDAGDEGPNADEPGEQPLTSAEVEFYLRKLAPTIVGRSLSYEETQAIAADGPNAIAPTLAAWVEEPGFSAAMRDMMETLLAVSGTRDGIDFELPGNLVAQVAALDLPWSTILTADYCVDGAGAEIACDTGAPYDAGVLATRAYLISNKGRFNLSRAKRMLSTFGCRAYPMEASVQPLLAKEVLIPMFQAQTEAEQTVDEAKGGFGNGEGCYTCHAQFGAHAQLFVKYDENGLWQVAADGLQDPAGELGRSLDGLYTSHMNDPAEAREEVTQVFGEQVANLREAGEVIGDHPLFFECTAKNLIATAFRLEAGNSDQIESELVAALAEKIVAVGPDPTIAQIVQTVFTDEEVVRAVVAGMEAGA